MVTLITEANGTFPLSQRFIKVPLPMALRVSPHNLHLGMTPWFTASHRTPRWFLFSEQISHLPFEILFLLSFENIYLLFTFYGSYHFPVYLQLPVTPGGLGLRPNLKIQT